MIYQLVFYVPNEHCEAVKDAIFAAGAGRIGNYEACAWQVSGQGQFQPVRDAKPYIGTLDTLERIEEVRVECVVAAPLVREVLNALIEAHPFEVPAYGVWPCMTIEDFE